MFNQWFFDNLMSENKFELELSTINDKSDLVCNKFRYKLTSLIINILSEFFLMHVKK